jgi:hypothetical protein
MRKFVNYGCALTFCKAIEHIVVMQCNCSDGGMELATVKHILWSSRGLYNCTLTRLPKVRIRVHISDISNPMLASWRARQTLPTPSQSQPQHLPVSESPSSWSSTPEQKLPAGDNKHCRAPYVFYSNPINQPIVTSLHAWRKTHRAGKYNRYFDFKRL